VQLLLKLKYVNVKNHILINILIVIIIKHGKIAIYIYFFIIYIYLKIYIYIYILITISYKPKCKFSCNGGFCINNDVCNCNTTIYTGKFCNEYKKLNRINEIDITVESMSYILICTSLFIIGVTSYFHFHPIIKGGKNCSHFKFLYFKRIFFIKY